jgi:hypothetical protein
LRHQETIERVLVNWWELNDFCRVTCDDRQVIETCRFHASDDLVGIRFEFTQSGFDADFPD